MSERKMIYLCLAHMSEDGAEQKYIKEAFDTNWVVPLGPNVNGFETDLEYFFKSTDNSQQSTDCKVVCLSAGTAAVHLALLACGVGPGDEVLVQSFTFCASAHPVTYLGATPVFVDSEPVTWNMDPDLLEEAIKDRIAQTGKKPKAIIPVALYGMPYDCTRIMEIANRYEIPVIEDAAEGFGSKFNGQMLGTFGKYGVLSFNGNKMITTSGGGALICNGAHPSLSQPSPKGEDFVGVHSANPMLYGILKDFAKEHRNNPTEAESILWEMLRGKGLDYKFRRQHIIGDCIADFFCCENNLCIELDGGYHNVPAQIKRDDERTKYLQERGCIEIRFTNEEVIANTEHVLEVIKRFCDVLPNLKSYPSGEDLGGAPSVDANQIMWYATQARDAYPYYQHSAIGYNYRMSNICAGIGRGQMTVAQAHIDHHKQVQALYEAWLKDVKGIEVHKQPETGEYDSNFWLCCITLDENLQIKGQEYAYKEVIKSAVGGAAGVIQTVESATTDCQPNENVEALRVFLQEKKIEARPVWKPMHKQPVYQNAPAYVNGVSEAIFKIGLCLPAGPCVTEDDVRYIVDCIKEAII